MEKKRPFFTRFLENQMSEDKMQEMSGGVTQKYPSDNDESGIGDIVKTELEKGKVTLKYPSDSDEDHTMKAPSDSDEI